MKQYKVAVLGATGAVGREMIKILEERNFPVSELIPLASARSAGSVIPFRGEDVVVKEVTPDCFGGIDIVLGAAPNKLAKEYAPHIVAAGAVFVDNSSAFRMDKDVPLVIPEINPEDALNHKGIISNRLYFKIIIELGNFDKFIPCSPSGYSTVKFTSFTC